MRTSAVTVAGPSGPLSVYQYGSQPAGARNLGWAPDPVVFIHPVNTGAAVWENVARAIGAGRAVLVPDLRGHGRSTKLGPFTAEGYAGDVLATLDHFGYGRAHLVGGSIGGPVGVWLAATAPGRVRSLASFGGALRLSLSVEALDQIRSTLERGVDALLYELVPGALARGHRSPELIERAVAIAQGPDRSPGLVYEIIVAAFSTDVSELAKRSRVPSLIVNGDEDLACSVEEGRRMAESLGGHVEVLKGVGHLPMLEAPEAVVSLLDAHLLRVDRVGAVP